MDESGFQPAGGCLGAVVEAWDGLIYVGELDFRIRFMNRRFVQTLGRDATEESCFRPLQGREEPCLWCPREVFAGKNVSGYFHKPMDEQWYHVSNSPLPLVLGEVVNLQEVVTNLHDHAVLLRYLPKGLVSFRKIRNDNWH